LLSVAGKSVSVVGNAASLLARDHGAAIEGRDVVIRMNRSLPIDPRSQGRRTDVLAFSTFRIVADIYTRFGARKLLWMSPKLRFRAGELGVPEGVGFYDLGRWEALHARLGARPSVGAMVLDWLSACDPREVAIFGFDFKRTPTSYQTKEHVGPHDYAAEQVFCEALVARHGWHFVGDYED
jgi:hypothetical protein